MHALSSKRRHIIYSDSGAGALKHAASVLRQDPLQGFLAYGQVHQAFLGPLDLLAEPVERRKWLDAHAPGITEWMGTDKHDDALVRWWDNVRAKNIPTTVWCCSRDVGDMSFLLALCNEAHFHEDTLLVDVASMNFIDREVTSTGDCQPEQMLEASSHAVPLQGQAISSLKHQYQKLVQAPEGLRRFDENGMVQAAGIDSHDSTIRSCLSQDWRPYGEMMTDIVNHERSHGVREIDYIFAVWRVDAMVAGGEVERRGGSKRPPFEEDPTMGELRLVR